MYLNLSTFAGNGDFRPEIAISRDFQAGYRNFPINEENVMKETSVVKRSTVFFFNFLLLCFFSLIIRR